MPVKKSLLEPLVLRQPLRQVRVAGFLRPAEAAEQLRQELEQASYERGRREGEQALSEQLVRQRAELLELQNGVLDTLQQTLPHLRQECERELIGVALEAAAKLVAGLPISAERIEAVVREALQQVEDTTSITVQLHPEDLALLQKTNSPLLLPGGGVERMRFQGLASVSRGGCIVLTQFGAVDARREAKIELLKRALLS